MERKAKMKKKSKSNPHKASSFEDLQEIIRKLTDTPGLQKYKYMVVIFVDDWYEVYTYTSVTSHEQALQHARLEYLASPFCRLGIGSVYVVVYGFCNTTDCHCGNEPDMVPYVIW